MGPEAELRIGMPDTVIRTPWHRVPDDESAFQDSRNTTFAATALRGVYSWLAGKPGSG